MNEAASLFRCLPELCTAGTAAGSIHHHHRRTSSMHKLLLTFGLVSTQLLASCSLFPEGTFSEAPVYYPELLSAQRTDSAPFPTTR